MAAGRGPARGAAAVGRAPALPSPAVEERADVYARVTEAIVAAIEERDMSGAGAAMRLHLLTVERNLHEGQLFGDEEMQSRPRRRSA